MHGPKPCNGHILWDRAFSNAYNSYIRYFVLAYLYFTPFAGLFEALQFFFKKRLPHLFLIVRQPVSIFYFSHSNPGYSFLLSRVNNSFNASLADLLSKSTSQICSTIGMLTSYFLARPSAAFAE